MSNQQDFVLLAELMGDPAITKKMLEMKASKVLEDLGLSSYLGIKHVHYMDTIYPRFFVTVKATGAAHVPTAERDRLRDPFEVFDTVAEVLGQPLTNYQWSRNHTRYFGHIGSVMYYARKRRPVIPYGGNGPAVIPEQEYNYAWPYDIDLHWNSHRMTAEISATYLLPQVVVPDRNGVAIPTTLEVKIKTSTYHLGISHAYCKKVGHTPARVVIQPPEHDRLTIDRVAPIHRFNHADYDAIGYWKIWGNSQSVTQNKSSLYQLEGVLTRV